MAKLQGFACGHSGIVSDHDPKRLLCLSCSTWQTLEGRIDGWTPEPRWPTWTGGTPEQKIFASDTRAWFVGHMEDEEEKYPVRQWFDSLAKFTDASAFLDLTPRIGKSQKRSYNPLKAAVLTAAGFQLPPEMLVADALEKERTIRKLAEEEAAQLREMNERLKAAMTPMQAELERLRAQSIATLDLQLAKLIRRAADPNGLNANEIATTRDELIRRVTHDLIAAANKIVAAEDARRAKTAVYT